MSTTASRFVDGFVSFIGNGSNSVGRFPANLSELDAALREYASLARRRITNDAPLFGDVA